MNGTSTWRCRTRGVGVCILMLLLTATARAGDGPPLASWVSADATAYLQINSPGTIFDHLYSPEIQGLIEASPQLGKQLKDKSFRELRQGVEYVGRAVGMSATRITRALTEGGVAAAFEAPDRFIVAARAKDAETLQKAHDTLLQLMRQDAQQKKKDDPIKTTEHQGQMIYQLSPQEAHVLLDGVLVASNNIDALKRAIDRAKGAGEGSVLADDPAWKSREAAQPADTTAWAYVRLDKLRANDPKFMKGKPEDEAGQKLLLGPWSETLQKADWATLTLQADSQHIGLTATLPTPEAAKTEAWQTFRPGEGQGAAPLIKPEGTLLSVSLWRDFAAVWDVRDQWLGPDMAQQFAQLDTVAGQFFGGREFGSGVLAALGPNWRVLFIQQAYDKMDPAPDLKLPGIALVLNLNPEDEEFPVRLQAAFQSFLGLVNLGTAQQKAPPLMIGSESFEGVTIFKGSFLPPPKAEAGKAIDQRYNFSPSAAIVDHTFMLCSSTDAARAVVKAIKAGNTQGEPSDATLVAEANGIEAARLVDLNKTQLVMRNMLEKGNDKQAAEKEISLLARALRYLGHGRLEVSDRGAELTVRLRFDLGKR